MNHVIRDRLASEYSILTRCPFLTKSHVVSSVCEAYRSKADTRPDLQRIIDREWTKVSIMPPFNVGKRGETLSV